MSGSPSACYNSENSWHLVSLVRIIFSIDLCVLIDLSRSAGLPFNVHLHGSKSFESLVKLLNASYKCCFMLYKSLPTKLHQPGLCSLMARHGLHTNNLFPRYLAKMSGTFTNDSVHEVFNQHLICNEHTLSLNTSHGKEAKPCNLAWKEAIVTMLIEYQVTFFSNTSKSSYLMSRPPCHAWTKVMGAVSHQSSMSGYAQQALAQQVALPTSLGQLDLTLKLVSAQQEECLKLCVSL
ncbi:hypothetical protein E3N88_04005 [Mikania micrantha]|uniref:Uncharacterized protein n=1 Tax=Mikania micrantha TaxID=192012 RepID=A0A5N6PUG3_9ASTR|nr:hypothetical protein E3N88_04005 [Mikania micrantha]